MEATGFKTADRIVKGLAQKPAYLLTFGVCLLVFGGGLASGGVGLATQSTMATWMGAVTGLVALFITAIIVVRIESIGSNVPVGTVGDKDLEPIFTAVHVNIREALRVQHDDFHDWLKKECSKFRATTRQWAHGEIKISGREFGELLVDIFKHAKTNVFAAVSEDYFPVWSSPTGKAIIAAHQKGNAEVQRVFVFESLSRVTDAQVQQMQEQAQPEKKLEVFVYGIQEHETYEIPKAIGRNFVYVDEGAVIVSTEPVTAEPQKGTFYFKDEDRRSDYDEAISNIRDGWRSLQEFIAERGKGGTVAVSEINQGQS